MANSNDYAFIVGIDDYPDYSSLKGARKDAEAFGQWITTMAGVDPQNFVQILSSPNPRHPTQYDIDPKLNDLMDMARTAQVDGNDPNRLYFYFSGHGLGLDTTDVGLCLPYWSRALKGDNISIKSYLETLKKSGLFKEIIVFLDCCRVRDASAIGRPPFLTALSPSQESPQVKSIVFYASEYQSPSFEAKSGDSEQVRGFFTTALLDGLSGGAAVGNGQVTYKSLINYLEREVPRRSQQKQKPRFMSEFGLRDYEKAFINTARKIEYTYSDDPFVLKVTVPKGDPNFQSATVYDVFNEEKIDPKQESFKLPLFGGKYFVVSEFTDSCMTEEVDLDTNKEHIVDFKGLMVAPNDHEYQCFPAQNASHNPTKVLGDHANAGLLIFIRYESREAVDPSVSMNADLELRNEKGEVITRFEEEDLYHENNDKTLYLKDGYLNYSIKAPAGLYYLVYSGEPKRQMPLYLFQNRQTQLFMLFTTAPIFGSARIYLPDLWYGFKTYNPQDSVENKIDAATRFLQNAHGSVPVGLLDDLFNGKFQEPMRGLLAAYILLKGRAQKADFYDDFFEKQHSDLVERKEDYFRIVVRNLSNLLGSDSPDVKAIKLMTTDFMEDFKNETFQFTQPPLFCFGLREVIRRASTNSSLLPAGSMLIQIAPKLKADSVFSSWEALASFLPETFGYESTKDIGDNPDLDASVINSIYQLTIAEYRKNPQEPVKKGFDKEIAQTLALPVQTIREYMTAMGTTCEMSEEQKGYFRLDDNDWKSITQTVLQFPTMLQSLKLSDITGLKILEQQKLKKAGIKDLESLIQVEADVKRFDTLVTQIKTTGDTLTNWIAQAKKLVE